MTFLKKNRGRESIESYLQYRRSRCESAIVSLKNIVNINTKNILDIGCGHGSFANVMAKAGAFVTALDIDEERIKLAKIHNFHENINYRVKNFFDLKEKFDIITLFDVLEHLPNYEKVIGFLPKLLNKNGLIYVEYNPYYSIIGHHLYDFTLFPVQLLPKNLVLKLFKNKKDNIGIFTKEECLQQFFDLNKIRISKVRETCKLSNLTIIKEQNKMAIPSLCTVNTSFLRYCSFIEDIFSFSHTLILKNEN